MKKIITLAILLISLNSFSQEFKLYAVRTNRDNTLDSIYRKWNTDSLFLNGSYIQRTKEYYEGFFDNMFPNSFNRYFKTADNLWRNRTDPYPTYTVAIHADGGTGLTLTDHPNSEQPLANSQRTSVRVNTSGFAQARLTAIVTTQSGSVNSPRLYFQYSTDGVNWTGNGVGNNISISTQGAKETAWVDLPAGAIGDVYVRVAMNGGNGTLDPVLGNVTIQFR